MTSRRSILLGLVLGAYLGLFGLNSVYAQVPRSISYQGMLLKNGQPVTGPVTLDIAIKDAAGNILYPETIQTTATNGIFNVLIGTSSGTLPQSLKFDEQYYITVSIDGQQIGDQTPFAAAPYALNAQTVGGVGVSVTPQAGKLLPLDANGKVPASALPQSIQSLGSIDGLPGDTGGNIKLIAGSNINILDNLVNNTITISSTSGSTPDTIVTLPPLTGGAVGKTFFTLGLSNNTNWITPGMIGTNAVRGSNLDQNIPQNGLYQDALGDLSVGTNGSLTYVQPTNTGAPTKPNGGVGINLNNTNNWIAVQNFLGGLTGSFSSFGTLGVNATVLTANGLAEPLAGPNGAIYEIQDNGDLRVTGSATIVGNTFIGQNTAGGTNTMGTAGLTGSSNTITGNTNTMTGSTSNTIAAPTTTIGTALSSTNTMQGATNNLTGGTNNLTGTTNNVNATTNNVGTVGVSTNNIGSAGNATNNMVGTANNVNATTNNIGTTGVTTTNNIGTLGTTVNNTNGTTNTTTGTVANNSQAPTVNIGTTQVAGGVVNHGTAGVTTNNINGLVNNVQSQTNNVGTTQTAGGANNVGTAGISTNNINGVTNTITGTTNNSVAQTINSGIAQTAGGTITIGTAAISTVTINGLSTMINGPTIHNGNITQVSGTTTLLNTQTANLTVVGTLTQSGGNATINGGATNVFGSVPGSANSIGAAGSTNTYNGLNNFNGNINQLAGTTTLLNTQINGTLGSTGNVTLGTASSNNNIGNAAAINTLTGATNNLAGGTNNLTGATNNVNASVNNIGNNSGSVNNIGTVSGGGISTNNIGNLNPNTNTNVSGTTTFTGATIAADGNQILRVVGGPQSCAGPLPTNLTSQVFFDGDVWDAGTLSACRLNIFGAGASCIANLNTTNFGSCSGGIVPINLISGFLGVGTIDVTNMHNIQATNNIQTNNVLTIGVPGTNATNIQSSNPGIAPVAQQTPSVSGRIPTFQQYILALVPGTGPNGGGSVTFNAGNTGGLLNFDALSGMTVAYRTHNVGFPVGELWITQTLTDVTVESSAAGDNNQVQLVILRP